LESSWRQNVPDMGLAFTGLDLCAQIVGFPGYAVGSRKDAASLKRIDLVYDPGLDMWVEWNESVPPEGFPHFPYGSEVDPD